MSEFDNKMKKAKHDIEQKRIEDNDIRELRNAAQAKLFKLHSELLMILKEFENQLKFKVIKKEQGFLFNRKYLRLCDPGKYKGYLMSPEYKGFAGIVQICIDLADCKLTITPCENYKNSIMYDYEKIACADYDLLLDALKGHIMDIILSYIDKR